MKNNLLKVLAVAAISCSALVALADKQKDNIQLASNESSYKKNIMSDIGATAAIKKKFLEDSEIKSFSIYVTTINGRVTLAGTVPNESVKDKVVALAKNTKGVLNVDNNLEVAKSGIVKRLTTDAAITNEIKLKYLTDDSIDALDIHVTTERGEVTLVGTIPSSAIESRAVDIAKNVKSVKNVVSKLEVYQSNGVKNLVSDSKITVAIKLKLLKDSNVNSLDIGVETINGKVTLKGLVPSDSAKDNIIKIAKSTDNVIDVTSMLVEQK